MRFRWRILWSLVFSSICLMVLCAFTAVSLFRQQANIVEILRENVASRHAAVELKECLLDVNALLTDRVESVESLHRRAHEHLNSIERLADQPEEKTLLERLRQSFAVYLDHWKAMPPPGRKGHSTAVKEASHLIENDLLKTCEELVQFNARRIEDVTLQNEGVLRQLAWGIAGVSGLGGVAGLALGFGLARGLSHSIRRLEVQIQDASGRLGEQAPAILLTGTGDLEGLHDQLDRLSERIEAIVKRLQDREREVLRAEQMAAVGQLATGVAHEIRNPLTAIKMLVQASREEVTNLTSEDLGVIEEEIRRMERSLNTFLDFARPPKLERRNLQISALLRAVMGLTRGRANKQGVEVIVHAPYDVTLTADSEQMQQVLVNLVLNALDAMPKGGTLTLTVDSLPSGGAEIRIADTGMGIAPELMPRLFQPFVSDKETGLGMGLVISRRIIESHGGTLTAANAPTGGAIFTITFPAETNLNGES